MYADHPAAIISVLPGKPQRRAREIVVQTGVRTIVFKIMARTTFPVVVGSHLRAYLILFPALMSVLVLIITTVLRAKIVAA